MKTVLVAGAGGFIGGHLVKHLLNKCYNVIAVDIKPISKWYQDHDSAITMGCQKEQFCSSYAGWDLKAKQGCQQIFEYYPQIDEVYNLACNMGGMGFIENNRFLCMESVLINTHLMQVSLNHHVKKYLFTGSACQYPIFLQNDPSKIINLKESDMYPSQPEWGYGNEKLFSEQLCLIAAEDHPIQTRVVRMYNIFGPNGTWQGGREKAPAAVCRKILECKYLQKPEIEIWGDGNQVRNFTYIDDCIYGLDLIMNGQYTQPINLGREESVTINQLVDIAQEIAGINPIRTYKLDAPKGVGTRNTDNTLIKEIFNWEPSISIKDGMYKTYEWIEQEFKKVHGIH